MTAAPTPKYRVTLQSDDDDSEYGEEVYYGLAFAQAVAYAAQYLESRFSGSGVVDAVTYPDNVVQLFKNGVYNYVCWVVPA